eukprot:TCALIF_07570-PA protein Name:"Similar to Tmc7 Transmembrane channel-like protein 7 (Gallus gallus)" AED:0.19 eAED:0.19 QI:0/0/0/0.25/0.66/0.75/4/0/609
MTHYQEYHDFDVMQDGDLVKLAELLSEPISLSEKQTANIIDPDGGKPKKQSPIIKGLSKVWNRLSFSIGSNLIWKIESTYGSAVSSYFKFLKWISWLNLVSFVIIFVLIIGPQFFKEDLEGSSSIELMCDVSDPNDGLHLPWVPLSNASECCNIQYNNGNTGFNFENLNFGESVSKFLQDLLQGTNWMEYSVLFYGYYSGTHTFPSGDWSYNFGLEYIVVFLIVLLINLIVVVASTTKYMRTKSRTWATKSYRMSHLIFATWDHNLAQESAIKTLKKHIQTNMTGLTENIKETTKKRELKLGGKVCLWATRVFINVVILGLLGGAGYGIYQFTGILVPQWLLEQNCSNVDNTHAPSFLCFVLNYVPSLTITVANIILPLIFAFVIKFEKYSSKMELVIHLARSIVLRMASLILAFLSIYFTVNCNYTYGCKNPDGSVDILTQSSECQMPVELCSNNNVPDTPCNKQLCWESYLGRQFYQLTVVDFLGQLVVFLVDLARAKLIGSKRKNKIFKFLGSIEFTISKHVLDIVYSQTICWLAMFYAPLITLVTVIKMMLLFLLRWLYVRFACRDTPTMPRDLLERDPMNPRHFQLRATPPKFDIDAEKDDWLL